MIQEIPHDNSVSLFKASCKRYEDVVQKMTTEQRQREITKYPAEFDVFKNDALFKSLVESDTELKALCETVRDLSSKTQEDFAAALVSIFRFFGSQLKLAKFAIVGAVESCSSAEQLLVQDNLYKRMFGSCLRSMLAQGFLQDSVSNVLSEVCIFDLMLDPSRAEAGQEQVVLDRLYRTVQNVFDGITSCSAKFPVDAAEALIFFRAISVKKFGQPTLPLLERYLFSTLTAIVMNPHPLVLDRGPAVSAHRSLIAIAKVIQTTCNHADSNEIHGLMIKSTFLLPNLDRFTQFLKGVVTTVSVASPRAAAGKTPGFDHEMRPADMTAADWTVINRLVSQIEGFSKSMSQDALSNFLTAPGGTALRALCAGITKKEDVVALVPALYRLFRSQGLEEQLVTWSITEHIASVSEANPVFFGLHGKRTVPLMIFDFFVDRETTLYVRNILREPVKKIVDDPKPERYDVHAADAAVAKNASLLILAHCQTIFDRFVQVSETLSPAITACCKKALEALRLKHKGKELLALASLFFGSILSRGLQYPKKYGVVASDPSPALLSTLSNVRLAFSQMVDSFLIIGTGDVQALTLAKFVFLNVSHVFDFVENAVFKLPASASRSAGSLVLKRDLEQAQSFLNNMGGKSGAPVELRKTKSATSVVSPREKEKDAKERDRGTTLRGMLGKLSSKKEGKKGKEVIQNQPVFTKKSDLPPELMALLAEQGKANQRGKTVSVEEARAAMMSSPREPSVDVEADIVEEPVKPAKSPALKMVAVKHDDDMDSAISTTVNTSSLQMSIPDFGIPLDEFAPPEWKVGDLVLAQWDEDKCWYKASVDEVLGDDHFKVTFVDYGNSVVCEGATQIVELPEEMGGGVDQHSSSKAPTKRRTETFDADALAAEISLQMGELPDLAKAIDVEGDTNQLDLSSRGIVSDADLLLALDKSLKGEPSIVEDSDGPLAPQRGSAVLVAELDDPSRIEIGSSSSVSSSVVEEVDYEKMEVLPPLPAEPPTSKAEYKNYMRLKYEHQKRLAALEQSKAQVETVTSPSLEHKKKDVTSPTMSHKKNPTSPITSPKVSLKTKFAEDVSGKKKSDRQSIQEKKADRQSLREKKGDEVAKKEKKPDRTSGVKDKPKLLRSLSGSALQKGAVKKDKDSQIEEEDSVVRLERYDVLLDDELPPLPDAAPPITNKVAYKQYMVLRYEYERRGLLPESKPQEEPPEATSQPLKRSVEEEPPKPPQKPQQHQQMKKLCSMCKTGQVAKGSQICISCEKKSQPVVDLNDFDPSIADPDEEEKVVVEAKPKPVAPPKKALPVAAAEPVVVVAAAVDPELQKFYYHVGDEVEAKWEDGMWYVAVVEAVDSATKGGPFADVLFPEYGNRSTYPMARLRRIRRGPSFVAGDTCEARWSEDNKFYKCKVLQVAVFGGVEEYEVEFIEYGNRETCGEDNLRPLKQHTCAVCESFVRPAKKRCDRCGAAATARLTTMLDDLESGMDSLDEIVSSKDQKPASGPSVPVAVRDKRSLTNMFAGIESDMKDLEEETSAKEDIAIRQRSLTKMLSDVDAEMEDLERDHAVDVFGDSRTDAVEEEPEKKSTNNSSGSALVTQMIAGVGSWLSGSNPKPSPPRATPMAPQIQETRSLEQVQSQWNQSVKVAEEEIESTRHQAPSFEPSPVVVVHEEPEEEEQIVEVQAVEEEDEKQVEKQVEKQEEEDEVVVEEETIDKKPEVVEETIEKKPEVAKPLPSTSSFQSAEEKASAARLKARQIQQRLAEQKRLEEEAKEKQKRAEEEARQERLKKWEAEKAAKAAATAAGQEAPKPQAPPKSLPQKTPSPPPSTEASSDLSSSKSRASEILLRAKAIAAKAKGEDAEVPVEAPAKAVVVDNSPDETFSASLSQDVAPAAAERDAKVVRGLTISGRGRGRGVSAPPTAAAATTPPPLAGSLEKSPSGFDAKAHSPAVQAALEKARERLGTAKAVSGADAKTAKALPSKPPSAVPSPIVVRREEPEEPTAPKAAPAVPVVKPVPSPRAATEEDKPPGSPRDAPKSPHPDRPVPKPPGSPRLESATTSTATKSPHPERPVPKPPGSPREDEAPKSPHPDRPVPKPPGQDEAPKSPRDRPVPKPPASPRLDEAPKSPRDRPVPKPPASPRLDDRSSEPAEGSKSPLPDRPVPKPPKPTPSPRQEKPASVEETVEKAPSAPPKPPRRSDAPSDRSAVEVPGLPKLPEEKKSPLPPPRSPVAAPRKDIAPSVCSDCGATVREGDAFCDNCGTPVPKLDASARKATIRAMISAKAAASKKAPEEEAPSSPRVLEKHAAVASKLESILQQQQEENDA